MTFHATGGVRSGGVLVWSVLLLGVGAGCSTTRTFTIYSKPANATLFIDGQERGPGPITQDIKFTGASNVHHVRAAAPGYETNTVDIWPDTPESTIVVDLKPVGKKVVVSVEPVAAVVKLNGHPLKPGLTEEAEFTLDASSPNRLYVVTAERDGWELASRTLRGADPGGYYPLVLKPAGSDSVAGPGAPTQTMRVVPPPRDAAPAARDSGAQARVNATRPQLPLPHRDQAARTEELPPEAPKPAPEPAPVPPAGQSFTRDITIRTDPPSAGASIYIGDQKWGDNAVELEGFEFKRDPAGRPVSEHVRAAAPGFDGGAVTMRWEDNRREYVIPLGNRHKEVRLVTDPPGAVATIDGKPMLRAPGGALTQTLVFPATDPAGEPAVHVARVTGPDEAWEPQDLKVGWDNGQANYTVKLAPARAVNVALLQPNLVWRDGAGWRAQAKRVSAPALRDVTEGNNRPSAKRFAVPADGSVPDAVAVSPDGSRVLYTALSATEDGLLRSSLRLLNSDATPGPTLAGDGKSLDLTPSFTPDGGRVLFSSDRGGGINVWSMPLPGPRANAAGPHQMSTSENATLWPTIDSNPQPRLFYEAVVKGTAAGQQGGSEIHVVNTGPAPSNITLAGGSRPRPSPRGDSVLFTVTDPATGNRDIYLVSDRDGVPLGGTPVNLTNTPDVDEFDAVWARNGSRIAFASNGASDEKGRRNCDIYVMTVADRKQTRVTYNGSLDDCPAWDPGGKTIYFRSNRGGQWGIWTVAVP